MFSYNINGNNNTGKISKHNVSDTIFNNKKRKEYEIGCKNARRNGH